MKHDDIPLDDARYACVLHAYGSIARLRYACVLHAYESIALQNKGMSLTIDIRRSESFEQNLVVGTPLVNMFTKMWHAG